MREIIVPVIRYTLKYRNKYLLPAHYLSSFAG
jgi:hypothetical protein